MEQQADMALIGGFLSAINSFALETEKNMVKNLTIGESFWILVKIHELDDLFLAVHTDAFPEDQAKILKTKLLEKFILEILNEFTTQFPASFFKKPPASLAPYRKIKEFTKVKIKEYNLLLTQYQGQYEDAYSIPEARINDAQKQCA